MGRIVGWKNRGRNGGPELGAWVFFAVTVYYDYGTLLWSMEGAMPGKRKKSMQEVAISEFKAKCLSLLKEVSKTKTPLRVTRRGKAIADVVPAPSETEERGWIGSMSESIKIVGDIVSPVVDTKTIEALKN
jgi:prevent-host-death family protein